MFLISIVMRTAWNVRNLSFSHAYTLYHIDKLVNLKNCICTTNYDLSQTSAKNLEGICNNELLAWGEKEIFVTMWLKNNAPFLIDQGTREIMLFIVKPMGRSIMISNRSRYKVCKCLVDVDVCVDLYVEHIFSPYIVSIQDLTDVSKNIRGK